MRGFLDTNILLDYLNPRGAFTEQALRVLLLVTNQKHTLLVADMSIVNIRYVTRKEISQDKFYQIIKRLEKHIVIIGMGEPAITRAIEAKWIDFEDAVQYYAAEEAHADVIITRNKKDFISALLPIFTPEEFIQNYS